MSLGGGGVSVGGGGISLAGGVSVGVAGSVVGVISLSLLPHAASSAAAAHSGIRNFVLMSPPGEIVEAHAPYAPTFARGVSVMRPLAVPMSDSDLAGRPVAS